MYNCSENHFRDTIEIMFCTKDEPRGFIYRAKHKNEENDELLPMVVGADDGAACKKR